jgi:hypothetical protein
MTTTTTRRPAVSCDDLVCAACSGPVEDGRCSVCRAARAHLHAQRPALPAGPVLVAAALLLALLLMLTR